jgi:hypothetical protein
MPAWVAEPPLFDELDVAPTGRSDASRVAACDVSCLEGPSDASPASAATGRRCAWCGGLIPARARRDAMTCSKSCRQARHRFGRAVGVAPPVAAARRDVSLRLAYADPPYPGKAFYYRGHRDYAGEVDHGELIGRLCSYDGWALSTSAAALPQVLALCPAGVRVAAWFRGARANKAARGPLNGWEPVIFHGGRLLPPDPSRGDRDRRVDALVHGVAARLTDPGWVIGAKPAAFAGWLFDLLGALPGDTLDDLFPGSGGIGRAWSVYTGETAPPASTLTA